MTTDYASELLGGAQPAQGVPVPAQTNDYAAQLLGGKEYAASQAVRPVERESLGASFGALTKASAVDNQQTKLRIFAKSRFPDLPEEEAVNKYGIIGGEIVYLDKDDKIKKESPSGVGGFFKEMGAGLLGNLPTVVGGTVGAVAGAPFGLVGAAGGAALGATGGKAINQVIANLLFDEPQTVGGNIKGMAQEGAVNAATTWLGSALSKKIAERALTRDIAKLDRPAAQALAQKGADIGVDLNVAQTTNLPSLKGRYEVLGRLEPSMDIIDASRVKQGTQAAAAVDKFLARMSPIDSADEAGTLARDAAGTVIKKLTQERAAQASPIYKQAFSEFQGIPQELVPQATELMKRPSMRAAGQIAARIAKDEGIDLAQPQSSLQGMHYMKLALDKMIGDEAKGGLQATSRGALIGLKNQLIGIMDELSPAYKQARGIYSHLSPNIDSVKEGVISKIANLGDEQAFKAAETMFGPNMSPSAINRAKALFQKSGLQDDWQTITRAYLQQTFEKAGQEFKSGAGGVRGQAASWRAAMVGNPRQQANIMAAMDGPQRQSFNEMMDVFEAMGRVSGAGGSPTMPLQVAKEQLTREAAGPMAKTVEFAIAPMKSIREWLSEARLGKHAEEMARVMTSPDGLSQLKQLRQMSPNDKRAIAAFSSLFGIGKQSDQSAEDTPIKQQ